jgi:hypothetical protein
MKGNTVVQPESVNAIDLTNESTTQNIKLTKASLNSTLEDDGCVDEVEKCSYAFDNQAFQDEETLPVGIIQLQKKELELCEASFSCPTSRKPPVPLTSNSSSSTTSSHERHSILRQDSQRHKGKQKNVKFTTRVNNVDQCRSETSWKPKLVRKMSPHPRKLAYLSYNSVHTLSTTKRISNNENAEQVHVGAIRSQAPLNQSKSIRSLTSNDSFSSISRWR